MLDIPDDFIHYLIIFLITINNKIFNIIKAWISPIAFSRSLHQLSQGQGRGGPPGRGADGVRQAVTGLHERSMQGRERTQCGGVGRLNLGRRRRSRTASSTSRWGIFDPWHAWLGWAWDRVSLIYFGLGESS
jgi:hypothetical protein